MMVIYLKKYIRKAGYCPIANGYFPLLLFAGCIYEYDGYGENEFIP